MEIIKADLFGFCFGVRRAVDIVEEKLEKRKKIDTLGPIVHNPNVVEDLSAKGAEVVNSLDSVDTDSVIITAHGAGREIHEEIEEKGSEGLAVKCDVSKKDEVDEMFEKTIERFGNVDILVNNAGIADFKPFLEMSEEEWEKTIDVNLKGYFLCAKKAAEEMGKGGSIVNIASVAMGQIGIGYPTLSHYTASKGGVVGLTEALAAELAPRNIRVNSVSPGAINTSMASETQEGKAAKRTLARIPMNRFGEPEEVSNAVVFLASDASSYTTGANLVIDGGWLSA